MQLPERPNLRHLRDQARDLVRAGAASTLAEAQFQIARQYDLPSWPKLAQVKALRDGKRTSFVAGRAPTVNMSNTAKAMHDDEIFAAATYFAGLPPKSFVRVVESFMIPQSKIAGWVYKFDRQGKQEPLGPRIIEGPEDFDQFELRDPSSRYIAYVPEGSIALGKRLAETWETTTSSSVPAATRRATKVRTTRPVLQADLRHHWFVHYMT